MRVSLLLACVSLLCGLSSHGQEEDPFGPEKKTPKRGQAAKSDAAFNRLMNAAKRHFEDDFVEAGGGAFDDGRYLILVKFESKTVPAKELQARLIRAVSTLYRTKIPLRELRISVKSNRATTDEVDPTDFVRVRLNLVAPVGAEYDPATGRVMKRGGDSHAYSDPTYNYETKQAVTCAKVFGKDWTEVGHYHSHPRGSGYGPSEKDREATALIGRRFLGVVAYDYGVMAMGY